MRLSQARAWIVWLPAAMLAWLAWAPAARAGAVEIPTAVAGVLQGQGQGLCVANAVSTTPATDFPQSSSAFNDGLNAFMEAHAADRVELVQRTVFDLSNNQDTGPKISWGDFTNAMAPACPTGGCPFFMNDTATSFGSRFRGFLNVTSSLVNQPVHIGFYADDAVSLTIWDKTATAHSVIVQPPVLGAPTWRMTQEVQFDQPGLYPLEILYAQIVEHAALEMSFFVGGFADFQSPAQPVPDGGTNPSLEAAGFTLFESTQFFQTLSGAPSYPSLDQCKQCDRQLVGQAGNTGCDAGYYCNEAALCAPCDTAAFCGPSCSPCGGATPFCVGTSGAYACAACRDDADCPPPGVCVSGTCEATSGSGGATSSSASATGASTSGSTSASASASSGGGMVGSGTGGSGAGGNRATSAGCGCRTGADPVLGAAWGAWAALVLSLVASRRVRRRAKRPPIEDC